MQARRTLARGQNGTKKSLGRYGEQLICVRYRHDEQRRKLFTTVEIIVVSNTRHSRHPHNSSWARKRRT
jgi:hypothetical protein